MGKDLHYSILPFIKNQLNNHQAVKSFEFVPDENFYILKIKRQFNLIELFVILSDDYNFNDFSVIHEHPILRNGGFILIAKPEANEYHGNDKYRKIAVGKIGKLLGALNKEDFWDYTVPQKKS